jgi:dipeptidyl aminopeptidase/acylaminoacyl peptidase
MVRSSGRAKIFVLCALLQVAGVAHAQSFTVEQVLSAPFLSELTAAARGDRVAWVADDRGAKVIWVAGAPELRPQQVIRYDGDNGQQLVSLRLTPDGNTAVYVLGSELNKEGRSANPLSVVKQPTQQVWAADVIDGKPRLLGDVGCNEEDCEDVQISPDGRYAVWSAKNQIWISSVQSGKATQLTDMRGEARSPRWSPDGRHLAFILDRGDHAFLVVSEVREAKLTTIGYVAPSVDRDQSPRWSPDGKYVAFIRTNGSKNHELLIPVQTQPWSIWVADAITLEAVRAWQSGAGHRDSLPLFADTSFNFAADHRIVFDSEQDGWNHLYSIDVDAGKSAALLTPGNFDVEDVSLSADSHSILYSSNQNDMDRRHIWRVQVAGGGPPVALSAGETIEWSPVETSDGKNVVCLGSSASTPSLVYRLTGSTRGLITKDALPASFPSSLLVTPKQVIFQSADGYTIHGQLFVPRNQPKPGPAVIFVHGGPIRQMLLGFHYMEYYSNAYAENQYLANLGFTVLSVNYRLGIMYGRDFREAPDTGWRGSAEYNDVLAGAAYLRTLPGVDPSCIGIWGGSYGGFLTALALARNSNLFAAGVDFHGVHDWSTQYGWANAPRVPDYREALRLAWESSPDAAVMNWKSPVLLIQGDDDRNVSFNQTVDLVQRLREQRVVFEQIVFPDEIHDFLLHRHFVEAYNATAQFLEKHLTSSE